MTGREWWAGAILLCLSCTARAFDYKAVVAQAQALARAPARKAANPVSQGGGHWIRIGGLGDGRTLWVRGTGPLMVTRLGGAARTVRCARVRVITGGPDPAVLLALHGAYFSARPAGGPAGTRAALLWPAAGAPFTHLWVGTGAASLRVYGLLAGPAATGAVRLIVRAKAGVSMAVRMTVFVRNARKISGFFPLRSMYWYGRANHVPAQALYPAAHDADGVLVQTAAHAIWQPLADPWRVRTVRLARRSAHAFGLLQRDRAFNHYESLQARYQDRPSVWVVLRAPVTGHVLLREAPWCQQRNIVVYWHPPRRVVSAVFAAQSTLYWGRRRHRHRGRVMATLMGGDAASGDFKYVIEYQGGRLDRLPVSAVRAHVAVVPHTTVVEDRLERNPYTGGFRQVIQVAPAARRVLHLRAWLSAAGRVVSEIWQYQAAARNDRTGAPLRAHPKAPALYTARASRYAPMPDGRFPPKGGEPFLIHGSCRGSHEQGKAAAREPARPGAARCHRGPGP
ncbi:MAG: glucan biosynthesis protein [Gammaproteobacteria bacterium]|nr:glucan biosynthesis protein [Gammaproteobacteria bacterium]